MKGNIKIYIIVCIAIFAILFLGSFKIGSVTIRNIVALLLGISIIYTIPYFKSNKIFNTFIIFLVAILVCTFVSGELFMDQFLRFLIAYYLTSVIAFIALYSLLMKTDSIDPIISFISVIFLLNAILTIAQSFNDNNAWQIVSILYPMSDVSDSQDQLSGGGDIRNVFVCGGLCGSVIGNGYVTSVFYPLATQTIWKKNKMGKVYAFFVMALTLYSSYCIQQRMCFYIVALYTLYMIILSLSGKIRAFLVIALSVALMFIGDPIPDINSFGHISQKVSEDHARMQLLQHFNHFLHSGDILTGGQSDYLMYGAGQHNTFLDCMTRYGIIGTFVFTLLFFRVFGYCFESFIKFKYVRRYELMSLSLCPLIYLLYSFTHSTGLQSGDPLFWVIFALLCVGDRKYYLSKLSKE